MKKITVAEAMDVVTEAIAEDPSYRVGWKANVAMAFFDRAVFHYQDRDNAHRVANDAANSFLLVLCSDKVKGGKWSNRCLDQ